MKIPSRNINKKIFILVTSVLLLIVSLGIYLYAFQGNLFGWQPFKTADTYQEPTKEQLEAGKDIEKTTSENSNSGKNPNDVGSDHPDKPVTQTGDSKATASLIITAANQNDGILQVRTLIGALANDGTCKLILTKDGKTVTRTAGVQPTSNSSTCKGFDIPVTELSIGEWQAEVTFENSELKATGLKTVNIL